MVSSCIPEEILQTWERSCNMSSSNATSQDLLTNLMCFLQAEVEGAQKLDMARTGFGVPPKQVKPQVL